MRQFKIRLIFSGAHHLDVLPFSLQVPFLVLAIHMDVDVWPQEREIYKAGVAEDKKVLEV